MRNIAIDGPAGAGKSTLAKRLAEALDCHYVDTGAIYRTIAYHFQMCGIGPRDKDNIHRFLGDATVEVRYEDGAQHMYLNGVDVTGELRTPELSAAASAISANAEVRKYLLQMQRALAREYDCVMDGRDIGTVVLPRAALKLYVTAAPEVRALRRQQELKAKGEDHPLSQILAQIQARDKADSERKIAPLRQADDAVLLDTTDMDADACLAAALALARERGL